MKSLVLDLRRGKDGGEGKRKLNRLVGTSELMETIKTRGNRALLRCFDLVDGLTVCVVWAVKTRLFEMRRMTSKTPPEMLCLSRSFRHFFSQAITTRLGNHPEVTLTPTNARCSCSHYYCAAT